MVSNARSKAIIDQEFASAREGAEKFLTMAIAAIKEGGSDEVVWARIIEILTDQRYTSTPKQQIGKLRYALTFMAIQLAKQRLEQEPDGKPE